MTGGRAGAVVRCMVCACSGQQLDGQVTGGAKGDGNAQPHRHGDAKPVANALDVGGGVGVVRVDGVGMAGAGWNTHILPVRVLGKCGGFVSDVVVGIDGKAAQQGYARYQKSFSDPPPQPTFVIDAK